MPFSFYFSVYAQTGLVPFYSLFFFAFFRFFFFFLSFFFFSFLFFFSFSFLSFSSGIWALARALLLGAFIAFYSAVTILYSPHPWSGRVTT